MDDYREWRGQGVYRSDDLDNCERNGMILDTPGVRQDDGWIGHHADVVVSGEEAFVFYFTHPGRNGLQEGRKKGMSNAGRRFKPQGLMSGTVSSFATAMRILK
ncbi:hypothetical protein M3194_01720 [Paenibacillus glycanilyticus]|uniref:hypothetical protein n=1 Tax=Paenibacillus glycanilyticus TaxID=126569 RepID=UPI00203BAF98|nr:hypothetical protein [Paenibacillus glycanilyticus]MCM3626083.1 hypothetical protein [Paenibacillus glycanilyticus]